MYFCAESNYAGQLAGFFLDVIELTKGTGGDSEIIPEFTFRTKVKAGLTGYAQIAGKYNTTAYDKLKLDLMYIENYSLLLDFKLLLMTIKILFLNESTEGFTQIDSKQMQDNSRS